MYGIIWAKYYIDKSKYTNKKKKALFTQYFFSAIFILMVS